MKQLIIIGLCLGLFACGGDQGNGVAEETGLSAFSPAEIAAQSDAYESMMDAHDRVMERMGEIAQAQKGLMDAAEVEGITEERLSQLTSANETLESAYDGMMNWMKGMKSLDDLRAEGEQAKILDYIKRENSNMANIEADLAKGITAAKELLGGLEADEHTHDHDHDHGHSHDGHKH